MAFKPKGRLAAVLGWVGPGAKWKLLGLLILGLATAAYITSLRLNLSAVRTEFANYRTEVAERERQALQTASTGRSVANGVRSEARQKITTEQSAKRKELDDALNANLGWANQPVPRAVADSLR